MTSRPAPRTAPLPAGISLAAWNKPPLEDYRKLMAEIGAEWLWFSRLSLSDGELERRIHKADVEISCLWKGEEPVGLAELLFKDKDTCEVSYFGVTEVLFGTTSARCLMTDAIDRAWSRPISRMQLNTCTLDSPKALDFYRRSGFVEYDRAVEIARDPRLNGVLRRDVASQIAIIE
ncbi:MAG: GNAT family N-acetyltransferase [Pseudomonadota bacterium]